MKLPFSVSPCLRGEPFRGSRGFSITELLVAMFIALIIFGIGFTILNGAALARTDAQNRIQANDNARLFFETLERDCADAYPGPWTPPFSKADLVQVGTAGVSGDVLTLTTTNEQTPSGTPKSISIHYYVLTSTGQLYREVDNNAPPLPFAPVPNDSALFPNVKTLNVAYAQWNESTKTMDASTPSDNATHLKVTLTLNLTSDKDKKVDPYRMYSKYIPIPKAFDN